MNSIHYFYFLKNLFFLPLNPFIIVPDNDMAFCNFGGGFMVLKDVITKYNRKLIIITNVGGHQFITK
jgi:hypothetical protein